MKIFIDNKSAHQFASQGQQRTIVLSMKIALIELIKEEIGEYPIPVSYTHLTLPTIA